MTTSPSAFSTWGLSEELLQSITKLGYETPTPVQEKVIPALLENTGDVIVLAKTGTGKTAAFGIPLLEKITAGGGIQSLVLCPTRELAAQVARNLVDLGAGKRIKVTSILGGESYRRQIESLARGPEIVVSTPGRLVDLLEQGIVQLSSVQYLILDEADEMLSFGFQESLERIRKDLQEDGRTWLFSATMSASVQNLSRKILTNPRNFFIAGGSEASKKLSSYAAVVFEEDKEKALTLLLQKEPDFYGIIFAQTKKQVAELEQALRPLGLGVESLHGDKAQADRHRVLDNIRTRRSRILVATDVAARGLDIQDLTHVVNFEIPWDVETYTHRIGRTARAGKEGTVWTLVRPKEAPALRKFERALNFKFENLKIPSQRDVVSDEVRRRLRDLLSMSGKGSELGTRFYDEILADFEKSESLEVSSDARTWLMRFLQGTGLHEKIRGQEPRAFELRSSDGEGARGSRSLPPNRRDDGGGERRFDQGIRRGFPPRRFDNRRDDRRDGPRDGGGPRFEGRSDDRRGGAPASRGGGYDAPPRRFGPRDDGFRREGDFPREGRGEGGGDRPYRKNTSDGGERRGSWDGPKSGGGFAGKKPGGFRRSHSTRD